MATIQDREATIRTLAVEIKALTVSGRQVTQALFKQLQSGRLIDETRLQLRGVPWGRVNYHFDCSDGLGPHHHVVWQDGEELRRDVIYARRIETIVREQVEDPWPSFWAAALHSLLTEEPRVGERRVSSMESNYNESYEVQGPGFHLTLEHAQMGPLICFWNQGGAVPDHMTSVTYTEKQRKEHVAWAWKHSKTTLESYFVERKGAWRDWASRSASDWLARHVSCKQQQAEMQADWSDLWATISQLEQLFIAV